MGTRSRLIRKDLIIMEQLLLDLHSCLDRARSLIKEYEARLRAINEREALSVSKEAELNERHKSIESREAECQKVERVVDLHKEATALHASANLRIQLAAQAERDLKQHTDISHQQIDEKRKLMAKESENILKRSKSLDDEVSKRVTEICNKNGIKI